MATLSDVQKTALGARNPYVAPVTNKPDNDFPAYGVGVRFPQLVAVTETLNQSDVSFYSDDHESERVKEFTNCDLAVDNKGMSDAISALALGMKYEDGVLSRGSDDTPPEMGFGFHRSVIDNSVRYFEGVYYPLVKAFPAGETYNTKGASTTLTGGNVTMTATQANDANHTWKQTKMFNTSADADLWVQSKLNFAAAWEINITVNAAPGAGGSANPRGALMVADGGNLDITVDTGAKVYDNGVDVTSSVAGGVYTLSAVAADHKITVIYGA